jgi:hypothetical protein
MNWGANPVGTMAIRCAAVSRHHDASIARLTEIEDTSFPISV